MRRLSLTPIVMLCLTSLACGCARRQVCPTDCYPANYFDYFADASVTQRGRIANDVVAVADHQAVDVALKQPASSARFLSLRPEECQCRAAEHAAIADLVDMERELAEARTSKHSRGKQRALEVSVELLALHAADHRNQAASAALELYYRLAEAEAGRDSLQESLDEVHRSIENVVELKRRGLQVAVDEGQLRRQEMELLDQQAQLRMSVDQLNGQLKLLLGMQLADEPLIWPAVDLTVAVDPIDAETAIAHGLAMRTDLAVLQTLLTKLDVETLPSARSALQQRDASLGSQASGLASVLQNLRPASGDDELEVRRRQLQRVYDERRRTASEEIRNAVTTVHTRLRQVALAKESLESHRLRLEQLKEKRNIGEATAFDLAAARLDVIGAARELNGQVVAWKIAMVKLKEVQGLLAVECGYGHCAPDTLCEPCPDFAIDVKAAATIAGQTTPFAAPLPATH
jgi:hypothetical protein